MAGGETLIDVVNMSAGYGGAAVVRDVSVNVKAGEVVALLGSNGAGKSTMLLVVSGLVSMMAGDVIVLGSSIRGVPPHQIARRGLAHVPEDRSLFFALSVEDNIRLGQRTSDGELFDYVMSVFPGLRPHLKRKAGLLSGGQQQMLAVARALVAQPKLLLIDEMSLGLAPIIVDELLPVVRRVVDETGAGALVVEQHVGLALEVADRGYVLTHGQISLAGSADELRAEQHRLEASYLGGEEALDRAGEPAGEGVS